MTTFKTSDFKILTCECFSNCWKEITETKDESWTFQKIEKGKKTFRIMFGKQKVILSCCHDCFLGKIYDGVVYIHNGKGFCTYSVRYNGTEVKKICYGCVWHFISNNENLFYKF